MPTETYYRGLDAGVILHIRLKIVGLKAAHEGKQRGGGFAVLRPTILSKETYYGVKEGLLYCLNSRVGFAGAFRFLYSTAVMGGQRKGKGLR